MSRNFQLLELKHTSEQQIEFSHDNFSRYIDTVTFSDWLLNIYIFQCKLNAVELVYEIGPKTAIVLFEKKIS